MKIVAFKIGDQRRLGVIDQDEVIDLQSVDPDLPSDLGRLIAHLDGDLTRLRARIENGPKGARQGLTNLIYDLPLAMGAKIICLGVNYLEHLREGMLRDTNPKFPTVFMRIPSSFVAHGQPIVRPLSSPQFDYESELVAVIGRRARNVKLDDALSHVAGFTCGNEGTVRDFQRHTSQWGMGKNFDRSGSVGPWVVTADELPPGGAGLRIMGRLNGEKMQSDSTASMTFPLRETIAYLSQGITLEPGDLIFTGTPSGVGAARKPAPIWMKAGDSFEVEIEKIGCLRNPIIDEVAA